MYVYTTASGEDSILTMCYLSNSFCIEIVAVLISAVSVLCRDCSHVTMSIVKLLYMGHYRTTQFCGSILNKYRQVNGQEDNKG